MNVGFIRISLILMYAGIFSNMSFYLESFITILRKEGYELQYLGFIYFLGFVFVVRFFWARLIDSKSIFGIGHYRGWILFSCVFMVLSVISISFYSIKTDIFSIILYMGIYALFSSTLYNALDGFIYKSIPLKDRMIANSIKMSGGIVGAVLGGGVGLYIYERIGWQKTNLFFSSFIILAFLFFLFIKENTHTLSKSSQKNFLLKDIYQFYMNKDLRMWFLFIASFSLPMSFFFGLTSRILVDIGWQLWQIGFIIYVVGYLVGAISSLFTSSFAKIINIQSLIIICLSGEILALLLLLLPLNGYGNIYLVAFIASVASIFYVASSAILSTLIMEKIKGTMYSFEYSMQHSLFLFFGLIYSTFSLVIAGFIGYEKTIIFSAIASLFPLYLTKISVKKD